ncbi:hypothetical protein QAD02_013907 [Eretmocerus hayati]|uniref:Uncharacterized protein n=1 Tax=Eretmocerus hayati TaxID=131215 RepID=A0ACC2P8L9_9HYME|nr:hypothetical protein QAD02_013907 [Eretmocerus hayati]
MRSKDPPTFARMGARALWRTLRELSNRAVKIERVTTNLGYDSPRKPLSAREFACLKKMYYRQVDRKIPEEKRPMMYRKLNDYVGSAINTAFQTMKMRLEDSDASTIESVASPLAEPLDDDAGVQENEVSSAGFNFDRSNESTPRASTTQRSPSSRERRVRTQWDVKDSSTSTCVRRKESRTVTPSPGGGTPSYSASYLQSSLNDSGHSSKRHRDRSPNAHHSRSQRDQSQSRRRDRDSHYTDLSRESNRKRPRLTNSSMKSRGYVQIPIENRTNHHRGNIRSGSESHSKGTAVPENKQHTLGNRMQSQSAYTRLQRPQNYDGVERTPKTNSRPRITEMSTSLQHGVNDFSHHKYIRHPYQNRPDIQPSGSSRSHSSCTVTSGQLEQQTSAETMKLGCVEDAM